MRVPRVVVTPGAARGARAALRATLAAATVGLALAALMRVAAALWGR